MATKPVIKQEFTSKEERLSALKAKGNALNKSLGIKGIQFASDLAPKKRAGFDIPKLDEMTGGGLVHGAFVTVWGSPGSGKTTLAYKACAKAQREGKIVYWVALEPFDADRAVQFGVNLEELIIGQFPQAEQCLDTIIAYAREKLVDVIILDSIHSMSPKAEQENSKGEKSTADNSIGLLARKLSQFFPMALDCIKRAEIAVMLIGQTRMSIGFISFEHLSGGNALLHNSRLILKLSRGAQDDAPRQITYEETDELDAKGNKKKKNVEKIIGFPANFRFDKVQVPNCKPEKTVLSVPYYYESGFELPQFIKDENAEIEKATSVQKDISDQRPEFKEALKKAVESSTAIEIGTERAKQAVSEPKKKRGRPKMVQ
jgi:RecA/RadA recombinase